MRTTTAVLPPICTRRVKAWRQWLPGLFPKHVDVGALWGIWGRCSARCGVVACSSLQGGVQSHQQAVTPRCFWHSTSLIRCYHHTWAEIFTAAKGHSAINELASPENVMIILFISKCEAQRNVLTSTSSFGNCLEGYFQPYQMNVSLLLLIMITLSWGRRFHSAVMASFYVVPYYDSTSKHENLFVE